MTRLTREQVACWLLKSAQPASEIVRDWRPGSEVALSRCVRRSYRLDLMDAGQPVALWVSGRDRPGVHALGVLAGAPEETDGGPAVPVRLARLADPVDRRDLLQDPAFRDAEVLRMPAGSNPSWLSAGQFGAVLARTPGAALGAWRA